MCVCVICVSVDYLCVYSVDHCTWMSRQTTEQVHGIQYVCVRVF